MRLYWAEGFNQSYILLRHLIERREAMINSGINVEVDEFCTSFPNRSKKIWSRLVGPYLHDNEKDADDFIVDDEDESEEEFQRPIFENSDSDLEEKFIQHLRKKRHASSEDESDGGDNDGGEGSDDDSIDSGGDLSIIENDVKCEEDSSKDEWMAKKLPSISKAKRKSKRARLDHDKSKNDESGSDDDIFSNDSIKIETPKSIQKKRYQFTSDDEDS